MNTQFLPTLLTTASLLLAGCLPESKNPLSTPATSRVDSRIEGVYVQRKEKSDEDPSYWHFHYRGASPGADKRARLTPWIEILGVSHEKQRGLDTAHYRALATHLGGYDYLSFIDLDPNGGLIGDKNYSFARYEVNWRGDLRIWLVDTDALADAVKAGKLRGKVRRSNGRITSVLLTDTTARLAAFVAASDPARLFGKEPMVFRRLAR